MEKVYISKDECCGCSSCQCICPKEAITMEFDDSGFKYPVIDQNKCIDCKLCKKVCSFINDVEKFNHIESYAIKHINDDVVSGSRSGGFFTAISDYVLDNNGIVYGASLEEDLVVKHIRVTNKNDRDKLRKSKYVQSDVSTIFKDVVSDLNDGLLVLFSGTSCQCGGLKNYLKLKNVDDNNLINCEVVCNSISSPGLLRNYFSYYENKENSKIKEFYFREKNEKYNWKSHVEKIVFENGRVFHTDQYAHLFHTDDKRSSCFNCKFIGRNRCTDITLADCWGGDKIFPNFVDGRGTSFVMLNTDKACKIFDAVKDNIIYKEMSVNDADQVRFICSEKKSNTYDKFWDDYKNLEFDKFMKKWTFNSLTIFNQTKRVIKGGLRRIYRLFFKG